MVGPSAPTTHRCRPVASVTVSAADARGGPTHIEFVGQVGHVVVSERDPLGTEGVRLDEIGAGLEVLPVDGLDDVGLGQAEQVVVALEVTGPFGEPLARKSASDSPYRWIMVPMAPSSTRMRRLSASRRSAVASGRWAVVTLGLSGVRTNTQVCRPEPSARRHLTGT